MSAQTVFSALDYLNRWTRARAHSLAVKTQLLSAKNRFGASATGIYTLMVAQIIYWNNNFLVFGMIPIGSVHHLANLFNCANRHA